jgi:hypothetical protein
MDVSIEQLKVLLDLQGMKQVPDEDMENIALRLTTWLTAMEKIEAEMGAEINASEPIPPVFPREEF